MALSVPALDRCLAMHRSERLAFRGPVARSGPLRLPGAPLSPSRSPQSPSHTAGVLAAAAAASASRGHAHVAGSGRCSYTAFAAAAGTKAAMTVAAAAATSVACVVRAVPSQRSLLCYGTGAGVGAANGRGSGGRWRVHARRRRSARAAAHEAESGAEEVAGPQLPPSNGDSEPQPPPSPASSSSPPFSPPSPPPPAPSPSSASAPATQGSGRSRAERIERLRVSLLAALSSLDRGLAANAREAADVDELCARLEALGGPVALRRDEGAEASGGGSGAAAAGGGAVEYWAAAAAAGSAASGGGGGGSGGTEGVGPLLGGTWRLVYSSGFNSGSLGGSRPGPPAALFPAVLGGVYQRIDPASSTLDNVVELLPSYGPPDLGLLREAVAAAVSGSGSAPTDNGDNGSSGAAAAPSGGLLGGLADVAAALGLPPPPPPPAGLAEALPPPLRAALIGERAGGGGGGGVAAAAARRRRSRVKDSPAARLTLRHSYQLIGTADVRIVYDETYGELVGSDLFAALPRVQAPSLPQQLRPPEALRSATFTVTYLDPWLRVSRGDRGELRVYLRDDDGAFAVRHEAAAALDHDD